MRRFYFLVLILACAPASAVAQDVARLPPTARQLTSQEIAILYDGKTYAFESVTFHGFVTGNVSYDLGAGTNHGTWALGSRTGSFDGEIRIVRDRFCYMAGPQDERCNYVYLDGDDIYEVKQSGIVDSIKRGALAGPH